MTEKEIAFQTRTPANRTEWAALTMTVSAAFISTLDSLAAAHGNRPGEWLDQLEADLIREAKGAITEGVPEEVEAPAIGLGIEVLQGILDRLRRRLVREADKD
jgi:hypothetical protein